MKLIRLLLIALLLQSCNARKTTNFKKEMTSQQVVQENIQTTKKIDLNTVEILGTDIYSESYSPIDHKTPIIITNANGNQVKIQNGIYSRLKQKSALKKDVVKNESISAKINTKKHEQTNISTKHKTIRKKPYLDIIWIISIMFAIGIITLLFVFYKKIRSDNY